MHYQRNLKHGDPRTVLLEMDKGRAPVCIIEGCNGKHASMGYCGKHYSSLLRLGDPLGANEQTPRGEALEFLEDLVARPTNECVLWPYIVHPLGYGKVQFEGHMRPAHRVALILLTGKDPVELDTAHGPCANRRCVNPHPEHGLRWATRSENEFDKKRDGVTNDGERNGMAKLTEPQVLNILRDSRTSEEIAEDYEVSRSCIHGIKTRRSWKYLHG